MRGAGLVLVLCWMIFLAILFAHTVGVDIADELACISGQVLEADGTRTTWPVECERMTP